MLRQFEVDAYTNVTLPKKVVFLDDEKEGACIVPAGNVICFELASDIFHVYNNCLGRPHAYPIQ